MLALALIIPTVSALNTTSGIYRLDFDFLPYQNTTSGTYRIDSGISPWGSNTTSGTYRLDFGFLSFFGKAFFAPNIINNGTSPLTPPENKSVDVLIWTHLNDTNQDNLTYARFWVTAPNSSIVIFFISPTPSTICGGSKGNPTLSLFS